MIHTEETQEQLKKANTVTNAVLGKGSGKSFLHYLWSNTHDGTAWNLLFDDNDNSVSNANNAKKRSFVFWR